MTNSWSRLAWAASLALIAGASSAANVDGSSATSPRQPLSTLTPLTLPEAGTRGQRAIDLLGDRLPEVAGWYRKSPQALRELLLNDSRMRLDGNGRLYVVEDLDQPPPVHPASEAAVSQLVALDQTFKLHSRAGAQRTIYLDFNGAVLTNTAWNNGGGSLTAQPFDIDGNTSSFSNAELERIQYIWQRVKEDYAPFDIDVTTEEPPPDALTRNGSSDQVYGTTALITNRTGVYNCGCGGVAYIGIYDDTSDFYKPALVFWDALGPGDEKDVAEAISHEVGHNLGLNHDGTSTEGYYGGHGSGETGWAPIMGVGYYQPLVQWSKGQYADANNTEDDFAVIQSNGGPLRADDHGDNVGSASPLTATPAGGSTSLSGAGVIERSTDRDYFSFASGAGSGSISITLGDRSPNMDARLTIRDAADNVIARSNPAEKLAATVKFNITTPGTYYVTVNGVGKGDVLGTGYSGYASVGQYSLGGSVPTP